jgi:hypothetical protein
MLDTAVAPAPETETEEGMHISGATLRALGGGGKECRRNARRWIKTWLDNEIHAKPISGPTAKPANVRVATVHDEDAIFKLLWLDVTENALPIGVPSPERIMEHIQLATRPGAGKTPAILAVIDGPDGAPVACVLLLAFRWWWSEAYFWQEVFCYVHPAHRVSRHAEHLMKFCRWCSDNMTTKFGYTVWLFQGVTAKDNVRNKVAFYSRFSNYIGSFFLYPWPGDKK